MVGLAAPWGPEDQDATFHLGKIRWPVTRQYLSYPERAAAPARQATRKERGGDQSPGRRCPRLIGKRPAGTTPADSAAYPAGCRCLKVAVAPLGKYMLSWPFSHFTR